jgi:predicted dehydrogenase
MTPGRVALIGCGTWGRNWLRTILSCPEPELAAVVDPDPAALEAAGQAATAAGRPKPLLLSESGALLARASFEGAVIATPIPSHASLTAAILATGRHVLVEKPLATRSVEAASLDRTARRQGLALVVGHTFLYSAGAQALRDLLVSGSLGELRFVSSERANFGRFGPSFGPLWELAVHDLSLLLWWFGVRGEPGPVRTVSCVLGPSRTRPEDFAQLALGLEPPLQAFVWCTWRAPEKIRRTLVAGLAGQAIYEETGEGPRVTVYASPYPTARTIPLTPRPDGLDNLGREYRDWLSAWDGRHIPRASAGLAVEVVRVLEAAERSVALGGRMVRLARGSSS